MCEKAKRQISLERKIMVSDPRLLSPKEKAVFYSKVFGISENASQEEIDRLYNRKCQKCRARPNLRISYFRLHPGGI